MWQSNMKQRWAFLPLDLRELRLLNGTEALVDTIIAMCDTVYMVRQWFKLMRKAGPNVCVFEGNILFTIGRGLKIC
jgi:hypothetical protein